MVEILFYFTCGFLLSASVVIFYYIKHDFSFLLNIIKEDIANIQITVSNVLDKMKK